MSDVSFWDVLGIFAGIFWFMVLLPLGGILIFVATPFVGLPVMGLGVWGLVRAIKIARRQA
jgi:hypothetical protein